MAKRSRPAWLAQFPDKRDAYAAGEITAEEYDAWVKSVRGDGEEAP